MVLELNPTIPTIPALGQTITELKKDKQALVHVHFPKKFSDPKAVGQYICQRVEQIYLTAAALHKLAQLTVNKGGHIVCATATLLGGLGSVYKGDVMTGGSLVAVAARELYNIFNQNKTDIQRLLQDASAGIDMIKTLEQANQQSFVNVDNNLIFVRQSVIDLEKRLKDINHLATQGSEEVEVQKKIAMALYEEASGLFNCTQDVFKQSKNKYETCNDQFTKALNQIGELVQLAQEEKGHFKDRSEQFVELSKKIHNDCTTAKGTLEDGNQSFNQGLFLLSQALLKFNQATFEAGKANEMAQTALEKIKARAQIEQSCQKQIKNIQEELSVVKSRSKNIQAIADDAQKDISDAQKVAETQFTLAEIVVGGGGGAIIGAVFSGGLAAGAGAVGGTVAFHNRQKIGELLFGKDPEPIPAKPSSTNPVTYKHNERSSGFWGRYVEKRGSFTKGKIAIDLGDEEVRYIKYNLNNRHKLSKKDLRFLYLRLSNKLSCKTEYAQTCLSVLHKLETLAIDRGDRHKPVRGFISSKDPYFADLKNLAWKYANGNLITA
jgi:hypothetical protein